MKFLKLFLFAASLFIAGAMQAQVSVHVNLGTAPQWGPAGYSDARYYYLPDVESYYDVQNSRFIYYDGRSWVRRTNLPGRYRNYDLYNGYKVVMTDYRGNRPYQYHRSYKAKYHKGYRGHAQRNIGHRPHRGNSHEMNRSRNHSNKSYYKHSNDHKYSNGHKDGNRGHRGHGDDD